MHSLKTVNCDSADALLDTLRRSNDCWWESEFPVSPWVFRGVGDAHKWKLTPSAWRANGNGLMPLIERIARLTLPLKIVAQGCADEPNDRFRRYCEWVGAETEALYQFACAANEQGFSVDPGSYQRNRSPITLKALGPGVGFGDDRPLPEVTFIAQHHGVPTRLLDWSGNPMVAAFFAAVPLRQLQDSEKLCVWALDTGHLTHQGPYAKEFGQFELLVHRPPRSTNQFLHSQGGVLTELSNRRALERHFLANLSWPTLEEVIAPIESERPILIAHTLSAKHADRLLMLLDREGINHSALMPTLDNVTKTVRDRWQRET